MVSEKTKKKKVSKRNKSAWRKHTDVQDVEDFLEEKRADARLGTDKLSEKKDSELFLLDTESSKKVQGKPRNRLERKIWANEPSTYQTALIPVSAVQDPIKRNRVRTKEERKHPARKAKDRALREKGLLRKKALQAKINRMESIKKNRKKIIEDRTLKFDKDAWGVTESVVDDSWLSENAKKSAMMMSGDFKVKPPTTLTMLRSQLPKVEAPHPGLSYNPSLSDHKELINKVVEKEVEMMRKDAHIARVTAPFKKRRDRNTNQWVDEVLQSLGIAGNTVKAEGTIDIDAVKEEEEEEEDTKEGIVAKKQPKMKTRKQRNAQKRIRNEAQQRKLEAVERKKISDMHRLKVITSKVENENAKVESKTAEKQKIKAEHIKTGTKRLARVKYQEPLEDFTSTWELTGSLRTSRPHSTLLKDRYYSLQKRNILQPAIKHFKTKKRKVRLVVKRDHRIDDELAKRTKASDKIKFITKSVK